MQEKLTPKDILNIGVQDFYELEDYEPEKIEALKILFGFCSVHCDSLDRLYGHVYMAVTSIMEKGFLGDNDLDKEMSNLGTLIKGLDEIVKDNYRDADTRESALALKHFAVTWYVTSSYKERCGRCISYLQGLEDDIIKNDFAFRDENYTEVMTLLGDCRMASGKYLLPSSNRNLLDQMKLESDMENDIHLLKSPKMLKMGYILDQPEEIPYRERAAAIESKGNVYTPKLYPVNLN